jgi:hypothetical protein
VYTILDWDTITWKTYCMYAWQDNVRIGFEELMFEDENYIPLT